MIKLLVVDDEPLILECFRYAFPHPQYQLITASDAANALTLFREKSPDVVLSDIRLPDLSGLDLFQQFHKTHIILANSQLISEYFVGSRNQSSITGTLIASEIPNIIDFVCYGEEETKPWGNERPY